MRPVAKDPITLRSPFKEALLQSGFFTASALRIASSLVVATTVVFLLSAWTQQPTLLQLFAAGTGVVLTYALVNNASPRGLGQQLTEVSSRDSEPKMDPSDEASDQPTLTCPEGHSGCWVLDSIQRLVTTGQEGIHGTDLSQVASSLARQACELFDANASWVYQTADSGETVALISSHVHPRAARRWEELSERAHQLAKERARSLGHGGGSRRDDHPTRVTLVGEYMTVALIHRGRVLGMMVVHDARTAGPSQFKQELLSALASQATITLENVLLRESQQDIEAKLRQFELHRADYVATLSHELRTPLTSIKGFAQLLTRDQETSDDRMRQFAGTIASEADKLALIVSDIVDLTRMETGLLEMHREPVALGQMLRNVAARVQLMAPSQQLRISLPERLPLVRVDPDRLVQVLVRLLVDATGQSTAGSVVLLAADAGEEEVAVRLEYRTTEIQIDDLTHAIKGPGRVTDDGEATQLGRGRLGLYICRNFIEAHGGKMWIEHPDEQVARVVFTLPY